MDRETCAHFSPVSLPCAECEIEARDAEIERLRMIVGCECSECQADEDRAAAEYAALQKDAERYRWLRENGHQMIGEDRGNGPEWPCAKTIDSAADRALAARSE